MRTLAMTSQDGSESRGEAWLVLAALGFAVLTVFGASVDERSVPRRDNGAATAPAPPTNEELVIEMLTHD